MRHFDVRESFLDTERKPLAGRVVFYKYGTTELENIYDSDGTPIANPVYTNDLGQLNVQVFLKDDTDYTILFEKYVGNGDFHTDPDGWLFQYSAVDRWLTYQLSVESESLQAINSMADLKNLNPQEVEERDGRKIIALLGYNSAGDKPTVYYEWKPNDIDSENGGSIISSNVTATGRWILINTFNSITGLDVRHFGVFGADSAPEAEDTMSYKISLANDYATTMHIPLYFYANDGQRTWYKINSLVITGALFAKSTRVIGNTGTQSTITLTDSSTHLDVFTNSTYRGVFTIAGETVRTSWGVNSSNCVFSPSYKLIVDSNVNTARKSWSNILVELMHDLTGAQLDGCDLVSVRHVGDGCSFRNMRLTELMFSENTDLDSVTVYDSDTIDIDDFPTTSKWMKLVLQNSNRNFDFKGRTVESTCINNSSAETWYKNANFDGYVVNQSSANFEDCTGTIVLGDAPLDLSMNRCNGLSIGGSKTNLHGVSSTSSSFSFGRNMYVNNMTINETSVTDSVSTYHTVSKFTSLDSDVNCNLNCTIANAERSRFYGSISSPSPSFIDCQFNGTVFQEATVSPIDFKFIGCKFLGGSGHILSSTVAGSVVSGTWCDNYSSLGFHFISINRNNIDPDESHHSYKYAGNTGPYVLDRLKAEWSDVIYMGPDYPGTGDTQGALINKAIYGAWTIGSGLDASIAIGYRGRQSRNNGAVGGSTDISYYLTECQFFTVGTQNIGDLTLTCQLPQKRTANMAIGGVTPTSSIETIQYQSTGATVNETEKLWFSSQSGSLGVPKGIMWKDAYTWRITYVEGMGLLHVSTEFPGNTDWEIPVKYRLGF